MSNLIDLKNGFAIEDKKGRREFRDGQVTNLRLSYIPMHSKGRLTGRIRTLFVWLKDEPKPFEFAEQIEIDQTDELGPLFKRLSEKLQQRLSKLLDAGKSLPGAGFKLNRSALTVGKAGKESVVPIDQLTMGIVDERLKTWRTGQDDPVLDLPFTAKNVYLLSLALEGRIPGLQTDVNSTLFNNTGSESSVANSVGTQDGSQAGLGRCIFERKITTAELALFGFVAAALAFLAFQSSPENYVIKYVFYGLAAASVLYAFLIKGNTLRCHERGVVRKTTFATKELRYDQLEGFTFSKTSVFVNEVHQGFTVELRFRPSDEVIGGSTISYKKNIKEEDAAVESLCAAVSGIMATAMEKTLRKSGNVAWTKALQLRSDGIEYQASGLLGSKPPITIPFENISQHDIDDGRFLLWTKDDPDTSAFSVECSQENFFPGYFVFKTVSPV